MAKIFHTFLKKYQFHPFKRLFDDSIREYIKTKYTEKTSTIYAITESNKASYIPETFEVGENYCITGTVKIGDKRHTVTVNIASTWYDSESDLSKNIRSKFKTRARFTDYLMSQFINPENPSLTSSQKYKFKAEVDLKKSNSETLYIKCPLAMAMSGDEGACAELHIYQTLNFCKSNCLEPLEIIYIGKSTASTFERLRKHEKWGPIMAGINHEKDYFVYFFEIDENLLIKRNLGQNALFSRDFNSLPKDSIVRLCEASLINHYEPRYNDEYVGTDLTDAGIVKKWLTEKGYTELLTEIELEGTMGRLYTNKRPFKIRQEIRLSLAQP